ncbi:MAG: hypothetical protein EOP56_01700 [Sphingobacteriales bacterium]|nr:MAG: hypothetical protein EOP56_01700 [Sphingobacteriales bacterium]
MSHPQALMGDMEGKLRNSLLTICKLLEKHSVQYMLIGGTAVALNGYYRHSVDSDGELTDKPDIDIWYNPTYDNYFNFLNVIEEMGRALQNLGTNAVLTLVIHFSS